MEMVERQKASTGLFANIGAVPYHAEPILSPTEMHSDILIADDLPNQPPRTTPSQALAAIGPMDVFLGSSPTPHARKSTKHIVSDNTSVATPTAIRTIQHANNDDPASSPPRFQNTASSDLGRANNNIRLNSSFEKQQPERGYPMSFDEGTTIEDAVLSDRDIPESEGTNDNMDVIMSEQLSPNIDLQLTAQIDADIQAHIAITTQSTKEEASEPNNIFVDAALHLFSSHINHSHDASDNEVQDSQVLLHTTSVNSDLELEVDTSGTSCVEDSFIQPNVGTETPMTQVLRRSARHSAASSPVLSTGGKQRKQTSAKHSNKAKHNKEKEMSPAQPNEEDIRDNIIVVVPKTRDTGRKRKSMTSLQASINDQIVIPETNLKRGVRRSQSLLHQVENSQDVLVEDTPASKRARKSVSQDVSAAKNSPPSQTKRLSHVQVTPKRSPGGEPDHELSTGSEVGIVPRTTKNSKALTSDPVAIKHTSEETSQDRQAPVEANTPSRSFTERAILTPRSIINQLRSLKDYLFSAPQLVLGREEEREIDDALFDIRRHVHAAGQRGGDTSRG